MIMRLIDADVLTDAIENSRGKNSIYAQFVRAWVKDAPTIDAVPVRYGHWVEDEIQIHVEKTYHCSECDCLAWGEDEKTRYCPICGARMNDDDKWEE